MTAAADGRAAASRPPRRGRWPTRSRPCWPRPSASWPRPPPRRRTGGGCPRRSSSTISPGPRPTSSPTLRSGDPGRGPRSPGRASGTAAALAGPEAERAAVLRALLADCCDHEGAQKASGAAHRGAACSTRVGGAPRGTCAATSWCCGLPRPRAPSPTVCVGCARTARGRWSAGSAIAPSRTAAPHPASRCRGTPPPAMPAGRQLVPRSVSTLRPPWSVLPRPVGGARGGRAGDGTVDITWTPVAGDVEYRVRRLDGDRWQVVGKDLCHPAAGWRRAWGNRAGLRGQRGRGRRTVGGGPLRRGVTGPRGVDESGHGSTETTASASEKQRT